jgi:hypothetical protein
MLLHVIDPAAPIHKAVNGPRIERPFEYVDNGAGLFVFNAIEQPHIVDRPRSFGWPPDVG